VTRHPIAGSSLAQAAVATLLLLAAAACSATSSPPAKTRSAASAPPTASTPPTSSGSASGTGSPYSAGGKPSGCGTRAIKVATAGELQAALAAARPGATIQLAAGTYQGDFTATSSGTRAAPITLCGNRKAVIEGESVTHGYALYLDRASWWRLAGFSVTGGQKGVVADGVTHDLVDGLYVHGTGDEGIHLRAFSSYNAVVGNIVRDTGRHVQFFGEGIYIGSAHSNWCRYTKCRPDASNYNVVADNNIADTTAESIDIKEGTTGGRIIGNRLSGTGMVPSAATAWVNVKGNGWKILDNTGMDSPGDGFQVHQVYPGWGVGNVFRDNTAAIHGSGYGIYVQSHDLRTIVACNNVITGAGSHLSNLSCSDNYS
jgi:Right handed beta helix region